MFFTHAYIKSGKLGFATATVDCPNLTKIKIFFPNCIWNVRNCLVLAEADLLTTNVVCQFFRIHVLKIDVSPRSPDKTKVDASQKLT